LVTFIYFGNIYLLWNWPIDAFADKSHELF